MKNENNTEFEWNRGRQSSRVKNNGTMAACLLIVIQSMLYGFGDPVSKAAYDTVPVFSLLSLRYLIAFAALILFAGKKIIRDLRQCSCRDWLLPSLCIAGSYILSNMALGMSAATSVAFLRSLPTVMTPILAWAVYRKNYSWKHIPIQILVVAGLYLLCGKGGLSGFGMGEILTLLSALLMSGSLVFGSKALEKMEAVTLTAVQAAVCAVMATVCAFAFSGGWNLYIITPKIWAIILYLAIFCTLAGYLLQNMALRVISDRMTALLQCLCPVMTAFFSYLILQEKLSAAGLAGCALILICVAAETLLGEDS